jgi:hypothetical protein
LRRAKQRSKGTVIDFTQAKRRASSGGTKREKKGRTIRGLGGDIEKYEKIKRSCSSKKPAKGELSTMRKRFPQKHE